MWYFWPLTALASSQALYSPLESSDWYFTFFGRKWSVRGCKQRVKSDVGGRLGLSHQGVETSISCPLPRTESDPITEPNLPKWGVYIYTPTYLLCISRYHSTKKLELVGIIIPKPIHYDWSSISKHTPLSSYTHHCSYSPSRLSRQLCIPTTEERWKSVHALEPSLVRQRQIYGFQEGIIDRFRKGKSIPSLFHNLYTKCSTNKFQYTSKNKPFAIDAAHLSVFPLPYLNHVN